MGTDIGLAIQLRANAQGLSADLNKASSIVKGWQGQMQSIMAGGLQIAGVSTALNLFKDLAAQFKEVKREADSVGASIQQMAGLKLFAKGDADALVMVLQRVQAELGAAADGSEEMRNKFPNWKELSEGDPVDLLKSLSAEYKTLTTQIEKANFARKVGGRGNQTAVMAMLEKGPGAIDQGQLKAANMAPWNEALERHARGWQVVTDMAKEAAGAAGAFIKLLADMPGGGEGQGTWQERLANTFDTKGVDIREVKALKAQKEAAGTLGDDWTVKSLKDEILAQRASDAQAKTAKPELDVTGAHSDSFKRMRDQMDREMESLTGGKGGKAHAEIDKLNESAADKQMLHLKQDAIDQQKLLNEMQKDAAHIIEESRTPLERLRDGLKNLEDLLGANLLTPEQADQAAGGLLDKAGVGKSEQSLPPALQVGSAEAQRFLNQNEMGQGVGVEGKIDATNAKLEQIRQLLASTGVARL